MSEHPKLVDLTTSVLPKVIALLLVTIKLLVLIPPADLLKQAIQALATR